MGLEIERKFLLKNDDWRGLGQGTVYRQGYLSSEKDRTVRVRIAGDRAYLTIKSAPVGHTRSEFEYPIPLDDAQILLDQLCYRPLIEKTRYKIAWEDLVWEIDEFAGENRGLIVAEVELIQENQTLSLPPWIGEEVTSDPRYYNSNLAKHPFCQWKSSKTSG